MKCILIFFLAVLTQAIYGQATNQKIIVVTNRPKVVPIGKMWILEANKTTKIQISRGVLTSGSMCNALFLSNPHIVMNINRGNIFSSEGYGIIFKNPEKLPYTNNQTYELTPISFIDKNFSLYELQSKDPDEVGSKSLVFKSGESVFVGNCIQSIEMIEVVEKLPATEYKLKNKKVVTGGIEKLLGFWYTPHGASINITFFKNKKFVFNDYNTTLNKMEKLTGSYELKGDTLILFHIGKPKEYFDFAKFENSEDEYFIQRSGGYFIKKEN